MKVTNLTFIKIGHVHTSSDAALILRTACTICNNVLFNKMARYMVLSI